MQRTITITVVIETTKNKTYKIVTDDIRNAVDFHNRILNAVDNVNYNQFPLFKNEGQEIDFCNKHTDDVADQILKSFNNSGGTFGCEKLNQIVEMFQKQKHEKNECYVMLMLFAALLLVLLFFIAIII